MNHFKKINAIFLTPFFFCLVFSVQAQIVTKQTVQSTPAISVSDRIEWVDLDNDADLDFIAIYSSNYSGDYIRIFKNENQVFTEVAGAINATLDPVNYDLGDYDGDGDIDLLIVDYQSLKILVNQGGLMFQVIDPALSNNGYQSTVHWRDLDGDTDLDIVFDNKIYLKDNAAYRLSKDEMPVFTSNRSWADVNNDGLLDMIAMRGLASDVPVYLYINQGDGKLVETQRLADTYNGTALFFDADNDGDLDLELNDSGTRVKLFRNLFIETGTAAFETKLDLRALGGARAVAADVNFDGMMDMIVNGYEYPSRKTYLYLNKSSGATLSFTESKLAIEADYLVNMKVIDYDHDNAPDLFMSGTESSYMSTTLKHVFKITFPGAATLPSTPAGLTVNQSKNTELSWSHDSGDDTFFYQVKIKRNGQLFSPASSLADGSLLRTGQVSTGSSKKMTLYNLPGGDYTWRVQAIGASYQPSPYSSEISFHQSDAPTDLVLTPLAYNKAKLDWSFTGSVTSFAIFRRTSTEPLHEIAVVPANQNTYSDESIPANEIIEYLIKSVTDGVYSAPSNIVSHSSPLFTKENFARDNPKIIAGGGSAADLDGDDDYDLGFNGWIISDFGSSLRLNNDGSGAYSAAQFLPAAVMDEEYSTQQIAKDIDNDGDIDICIVTASTNSWQKIKILTNNGGSFSVTFQTERMLSIQQIALEDLNYDGRPDLMYTYNISNSSGGPYNYKLLYQQADGSFADSKVVFLPDRQEFLGGFTLADLNNDSFTDVVFNGTDYKKSTLFLNLQGMAFQQQSAPVQQGVSTYTLSNHLFMDFTGDGKIDLLTRGVFGSLLLYVGNGTFTFTNPKEIQLAEFWANNSITIKAADVDNDGLPDLILNDTYSVVLMANKGNGNFAPARFTFDAEENVYTMFTDKEKDGDLDLVVMGNSNYTSPGSYYYTNNCNVENLPPSVPSSLQAIRFKNSINFSWQSAMDDKTPAGFLSYNLEIKDAGGKFWLHPQTNTAGTFRRILAPGNMSIRKKFTIRDLPAGTYTARIQAIDASFALSPWSSLVQFSIAAGPTDLKADRMLLNKITLSWTNGPIAENQVIVERKTSESEFQIVGELPAGSITFIDANLEYNKLYQYRVYEVVNDIPTAQSNTVEWNTALFSPRQTTLANVFGSLDVADIDGNGKSELLINGARIYNGTSVDQTKALFENTGAWVKRNVGSSVLSNTSMLSFQDVNGDHRPDLFEYGYSSSQNKYLVQTFLNDGNKSFIETATIFSTNTMNLAGWLDYDNDNDLDAFVAKAGNISTTAVLRNDGKGTFVDTGNVDPNCQYGCVFGIVAGDFDQDGDDDYFRYMGDKGGFVLWTNANGKFTQTTLVISSNNASLTKVDYNGDGWPDLYLNTNDYYSTSKLFKNGKLDSKGIPQFTALNYAFPIQDVNINWADFDHDGDLDLFTASRQCTIFMNAGNDTFLEYKIPLFYASLNNAKIVDYDTDGDLDVYVTGYVTNTNFEGIEQPLSFVAYNQLIDNQKGIVNAPPATPANLTFLQDVAGAHLTWDPPVDDHTSVRSLTYDVIIYQGTKEYYKGSFDPATGKRYKLVDGYQSRELLLTNFPLGEYTWKVQAVDQSYAGSSMSALASFKIVPPAPFMKDTVIYRCDRQVLLTATGTNIEWYSDEALTQKIASGIFSPVSTQKVYVTQTVSGVRGIARPVNITVYDKTENPRVLTSPVSFCEGPTGAQVYLQAEGINLRWYKDAAKTNSAGSGSYLTVQAEARSYFVTQTKQNCESLPAEVIVTAVTIDSKIYYDNGNIMVAKQDGNVYRWYKNNLVIPGANSFSISDPEPGTYIVNITKGVCFESSQPFVITDAEAAIENTFTIFPNPATGSFNIIVPQTPGQIQITDVSGKVVYDSSVRGDNAVPLEVSTPSWSKGIYFVTFRNGKGKIVRKVAIL
jgi:hypothetical protein